MSKRLLLATLGIIAMLSFGVEVAFAQTPVPVETPLPKVELIPVPDIIWRLWFEVFGRGMLYSQQPEPVPVGPLSGPTPTPIPIPEGADNFMAGLSDLLADVPPDWYQRIKDILQPAFSAFKGDECIETLVGLLYSIMEMVNSLNEMLAGANWGINGALDLWFHFSLGALVAVPLYYLTSSVISWLCGFVESRRPGRTSGSFLIGRVMWSLPWLSVLCGAWLSHLWWDGYFL